MTFSISKSALDRHSHKLIASLASLATTFNSPFLKSKLHIHSRSLLAIRCENTLKSLFCPVNDCPQGFALSAKPYFQLPTGLCTYCKALFPTADSPWHLLHSSISNSDSPWHLLQCASSNCRQGSAVPEGYFLFNLSIFHVSLK